MLWMIYSNIWSFGYISASGIPFTGNIHVDTSNGSRSTVIDLRRSVCTKWAIWIRGDATWVASSLNRPFYWCALIFCDQSGLLYSMNELVLTILIWLLQLSRSLSIVTQRLGLQTLKKIEFCPRDYRDVMTMFLWLPKTFLVLGHWIWTLRCN